MAKMFVDSELSAFGVGGAAEAIRVKRVLSTKVISSCDGADRVSLGWGGSCAWHGGPEGEVVGVLSGLEVHVLGRSSGRREGCEGARAAWFGPWSSRRRRRTSSSEAEAENCGGRRRGEEEMMHAFGLRGGGWMGWGSWDWCRCRWGDLRVWEWRVDNLGGSDENSEGVCRNLQDFYVFSCVSLSVVL